MRPNNNNNNNRRGRGRGPRKPHGGPHGHGGAPSKAHTFDSAGPDIRVRGNAYQVLEKYLQLARDAGTVGDRVAAENFLQHADHYYRVVASMNEGQRPRIGGREVSVAEVNVQNVSQGLSAALSAHSHATGGEDIQGEAPSGGGNGQNRPQQSQGNRDHDGRNQEGRNQDSRNQDGRNQDGRNQDGRNHDDQGNGEGSHDDGQSAHASGDDQDGNSGGGNVGRYGQSDDQPDYPEELLPQDGGQPGAADAQGEGRQADRAQGDRASGERPQGRMGRGRRRGPGRRVRGEGEEPVAAPTPTTTPENA